MTAFELSSFDMARPLTKYDQTTTPNSITAVTNAGKTTGIARLTTEAWKTTGITLLTTEAWKTTARSTSTEKEKKELTMPWSTMTGSITTKSTKAWPTAESTSTDERTTTVLPITAKSKRWPTTESTTAGSTKSWPTMTTTTRGSETLTARPLLTASTTERPTTTGGSETLTARPTMTASTTEWPTTTLETNSPSNNVEKILINDEFTNNTNEDLSLSYNTSENSLLVVGHITIVFILTFSLAGFFVVICVGFACFEIFVICKSCKKSENNKEPIYSTISHRPLANLKKQFFRKNSKTSNAVSKTTPKALPPRPISPTLPMVTFADRFAKLNLFFCKTKNSVDVDFQADVESASTDIARIHKPYVCSPSFVFGKMVDEDNGVPELFVNSVKTSKAESLKMDQSFLDLKTVVMSYTNENYVPPSALPNLPPLLFHTFKKPDSEKLKVKSAKPIDLNFDSIELAPI